MQKSKTIGSRNGVIMNHIFLKATFQIEWKICYVACIQIENTQFPLLTLRWL